MTLADIIPYIKGKKVLEIGGPSQLLNSIYPYIHSLDILNHPHSMAHHVQNSNVHHRLFLGDATDSKCLNKITDKYEVIITSHTLEHIANPIKALGLWSKLIPSQGFIINILPNKNACWDKNRQFTSFNHLLEDFINDVSENDMTHVIESDCMRETKPTYYSEVGDNNEARIIHHHCFNIETLSKIHEYNNFSTLHCFLDVNDNLQLIYVGFKQ